MSRLATAGVAILCASGCTVQRDQPNLVGQDVRLTIIHTADIHSRLFPYNFVPNVFDKGFGLTAPPYGGISRITTLVKRIRTETDRSLWLDSGDCFEGAPVFNEFKGEAQNWAQFPLLAANYAWDAPTSPTSKGLRDIITPYQIYDVKGVVVGVIGMGNTSTLTSIYYGGNSLGFRPIDDATAVDQYVRLLRPMVDVIVIVSHLGLDEDEDLTPAMVVDPNASLPLDNVDVVLGGHLHIVTNPPKIIPHTSADAGFSTVLVHSGAFAKFVGKLDLVVHVGTDNSQAATRSRVTSFAYINEPVDSKIDITGNPLIPDDPDVSALLWPYSVKINQDIDLNGVFAYVSASTGASASATILRNDPSGGDSQLGNLVARSMQLQQGVEAEFSITNSLGIRADFEHGSLTNEQMFNVFPFENTIVVMYLSGQEVSDTMDFVAQKSSTRGCRAQAQVAGITFDMVCSGTCNVIDPTTGVTATACAKNIFIGDNCRVDDNGKLNPDGPVNPKKCSPLSLTGLYRVATNNYIAAGGSGFDTLRRNSSKQDTGVSLRDALTVYLNGLNVCPTSQLDENDTQSPQRTVLNEYGNISCLDATVEQHDGRIRPVFE